MMVCKSFDTQFVSLQSVFHPFHLGPENIDQGIEISDRVSTQWRTGPIRAVDENC